jgi:hypothetical protein
LGPVNTAAWPASFDLQILNILHETTVYAGSDLTTWILLADSKDIFMSPLSHKFSETADVFVILS